VNDTTDDKGVFLSFECVHAQHICEGG